MVEAVLMIVCDAHNHGQCRGESHVHSPEPHPPVVQVCGHHSHQAGFHPHLSIHQPPEQPRLGHSVYSWRGGERHSSFLQWEKRMGHSRWRSTEKQSTQTNTTISPWTPSTTSLVWCEPWAKTTITKEEDRKLEIEHDCEQGSKELWIFSVGFWRRGAPFPDRKWIMTRIVLVSWRTIPGSRR